MTSPLQAQSLTKLRVANIGGTSDHIQVAVNAGVYKKHGFEVENIQVGSSATVVQSLIAGEVAFAHVGAVPVVAAVANGIDLKVIAVFMNRFNYVMASAPELRKPADLKSKKLAISHVDASLLSATQIVEIKRMGLNVLADLSDLDVEYAHYTLAIRGTLIAKERPLVERL